MFSLVASTPVTIEVDIVCSPALLAQGFNKSSYAPASPCLSGLPAYSEDTHMRLVQIVSRYRDFFMSLLLPYKTGL
jgi:hypothetical protein